MSTSLESSSFLLRYFTRCILLSSGHNDEVFHQSHYLCFEWFQGKRKGLKSDVEEDIWDYSTDENETIEAEPLACDRCCYKTQKKWLMDRHTASHAKDKPFRCPSCRFTNRDASVFVDHLVKHLPKTKIIQCCFCSFKSMPSMMKSHILRHGPTERLDCSECEYWTNSIKSMTDHIEAYHTKKHPCTMCSKLLTKYALAKHIKKVHKSKKPPPNVSVDNLGNSLKKTIASRPGLTIIPVTRRVKTPQPAKSAPKPVTISKIPVMMPVVQLERCRVPPECWKYLEASRKPQSLGTRSGIRKSLEQVTENWEPMETGSDIGDAHDPSTDMQTPAEIPRAKQIRKPIYFPSLVGEFGDTLLTCSICDFQTRKEHLLKRHTARHNNDLPFDCRKCDFKNISVYEFANHMITHEGSVKEDVYSCCFCDFWTHKKHNIPIHLDRHRGANREFDCPECEEVLTSKSGLQTHFEKLHCEALDCQFCGKNMTKFELNVHIKEHADEVAGSDRQASESAVEQPVLSDADTEKSVDFPVKPTNPLRTARDAETEKSVDIPVKPINPLRTTRYKPKPLSRKKLDIQSDSGLDAKKPKKIEDKAAHSATVSTKYQPKPLSKKKLSMEPEKTPSKTREPSVKGPDVAEEANTTSSGTRYQPRPLSKKTLANGDDKDKPAVKTGEGSDVAIKRKRSPTPTRAKSDSPKQDSAGKELECRYCDYKTQISSLMDRHREKHKLDTPFKCPKCKYETLSAQKLSWHYLYHIPSQAEFPCPYCNFNSKNRMTLPQHIERHRSIRRVFDCSKCQFSANHAGGVRKHYERMHVDKYSCTICDKVMTKHAMMKHLKKRHPSVYNTPASSTSAEVHSYMRHYVKYMKPVSVAADPPKRKRSKPSTVVDEKGDSKAADSAGNLQKPCSSQEDPEIKAAQAALAREIFGDMSDSEDDALKPSASVGPSPSIAAASKPIIKSDDSDDSDSDSETAVPKLSCPKCDFTTNQITEVKSHYRDVHEIEYACERCRPSVTSTKYELLSHLRKSHPAVSPEHYGNIMKCCAPENPPENRANVKMESEDSDDSDNEATACAIKSAPMNSSEPCVPPPSSCAPEEFGSCLVSSPDEVTLKSEVTKELQPSVPIDVEEPTVVNETHSDSPVVPVSADIIKLSGSEESAKSDIADPAVCHDAKMELDDAAVSRVAPRASSSSEHLISDHPKEIPESAASASVKAVETQQQKTIGTNNEIDDESTGIPKMRLQCKECNFQTSRTSLLQRHSVKHKVGAPLVCPQCHFQNNSPYEFLLHWTKHFPDRLAFSCCFCAFATVSKLDLALHFCVHNNTRVFDCDECDYSTSTKAFFEGHIWSIHRKVTCQKCQESMAKTELSSHKCVTARDDEVLNPSKNTHEVAPVSEAEESAPRESSEVSTRKSGTCRDATDRGKLKKSDLGSAGKQIIARESFKNSELRKFSFLRKRDDFPPAEVVFTAVSSAVEEHEEAVAEEPSPAFESLSTDGSFAEEESGNAGTLPAVSNDLPKIEKSEGTRGMHRVEGKEQPIAEKSVIGSEQGLHSRPPVGADAGKIKKHSSAIIGEIRGGKGSFSSEGSMKAESMGGERDDDDGSTNAGPSVSTGEVTSQERAADKSPNAKNTSYILDSTIVSEPTNAEGSAAFEKVYQDGPGPTEHDEESVAVADPNTGIDRHSLGEEHSTVEKSEIAEDHESPDERELPSAGEPNSAYQCLAQEDSFTPEVSFSGVPVIDISGKPETPEAASKVLGSKTPSTSWTEPIDSDDGEEGDDDHNYFISRRRSKSPAADFSPRSDQQHSSPVRSEDFPGDYVTEVVFDNGMTALVLEVSDSSEEEL